MHEAAAAAGAVDLNLLLLDGTPAAFVYGCHCRGYVYGLRRGYDAALSRAGAGNVLLARVLCDSFARGDRIYDMGIGSVESKRHFQTRGFRSCVTATFRRWRCGAQVLRMKRWWQGRRLPVSTAVGRVQDGTADAR